MRLTAFLLALALLAAPSLGRAQDNAVVVELFTSQGCSSCPPADALLTKLAKYDGVIALALHVDYWDYLGWADSFATPQHTARQRAYAKKARSRTIYTPQMVIQGEDRLVGSDAEMIHSRIAAHRAVPATVKLTVRRERDTLEIGLAPAKAEVGPSNVHVVTFTPSREVTIGAGENAGYSMSYTNIVTGWDTVGRWDGATPVDLRYDDLSDEPGAVIVQKDRMGPVLAAARF